MVTQCKRTRFWKLSRLFEGLTFVLLEAASVLPGWGQSNLTIYDAVLLIPPFTSLNVFIYLESWHLASVIRIA